MVNAPSPMLIAVGMYLPFHSTFAIFVGGIIKWLMDVTMKKQKLSVTEKSRAENIGVLISSGLIAGEALMAVILAFIVLGTQLSESQFSLRSFGVENPSVMAGFLIFFILAYILVQIPIKKAKSGQ